MTWSDELYRIFQLDPSEKAPRWDEHPKLLSPEDFEKLNQAAEKAISDGEHYEVELQAIRKDGEIRICKSKGFPEIGKDGNVVQLFGLFQDITDSKRVQNELVKSGKQFKNLFESTPIATFVWRCKGSEIILCDINDAAVRMTHGKGEQFVGRSIDQIYHDRPDMLNKFKVCLTSKMNIVYETEYVTRGTGLERFIVFTFVYISDELLMLHADDITDRKEAEKALIESEQKWRNILVNTPQIGISLDTQAKIIFANEHFLKMTGWGRREIIGQDWFDLFIPEKKKEEIRQVFLSSINQKDTLKFSNYENEIITKSGALKNVAWSNLVTKNMQGDVVDITCLGIDLTERKNYEKLLEKKNTDLRLAQRIASIGTWTLDPEIGVPEWSEEIYRIYERDPNLGPYTLDEYQNIYKGKWFEKFTSAIQGAIFDGTPYDIELKLELPTGKEKWVHAICEPEPEIGQKGHKVRGTIQDITNKRQAEEALRESEDFLNRTGDMARVGGWEVDLDTNRVIWTQTTGRIHELPDGYFPDLEEAIGYYHPEDQDHVRQCVQRAIENGESFDFTVRLITVKGRERWVHALGQPVVDAGRCVRLSGTFQDVTQAKQAELAREASEARYARLAANIPGVVFQNLQHSDDPTDDEFPYISPGIHDLFGLTPEEVMRDSSSIWALIHPDDSAALTDSIQHAVETGAYWNYDFRVTTTGGETKWVRGMASHERQPDCSIFWDGLFLDISDPKRTEKALRRSEERFSLAMEASKDGIWDWDLTTGEIYCSPSLTSMLGYNSNDVIESVDQWQELIHPDDRQKAYQSNIDCVNNLTDSFEVEYRMQTQDGGWKWIVGRGKAVQRDASGRALRIIGTHRDNTDHKRAVAEKETLQAQLHQSQKMESVGRLAGGVAHDFNNMLGVILGHTELALLQADENHDLYGDLKEIQTAAQRSADVTKQLLAFARKQTFSPKQLDLNDTVESMLNMLRRLIGEDIDLVWKPSTHIWPIKMDPTQVDQILANLCVNARDAIDGVGNVTIETGISKIDEKYCDEHPGFVPGNFVMLAVSDNGCGMDKDTLENLFEPFFTTKEVGKGTGLGLATVYGIVKQNNGFINVDSEPGQGSTFNIYLPPMVENEEDDQTMFPKKSTAGGTETILLVEDEPSILRMTQIMLERKGYAVLAATTPTAAVEKAKDHSDPIDLLITDVVMPEMNGRDLAGQITALYPDIQLLFMSGYTADVIDHQGVLDAGVAFIQKPFSMADMSEKVREVLDEAKNPTQG
ncbi:PAS domain-containing hybrid sensor histidine kinase/response regulator [Desulfotignum phosphitoxidans]|uniref:histidine kinase n=1 Tax=Desulfotignum phosphitoxidans DSM 13687 TaxID=1286635 RepID=S0FYD9_9BACT|nr:PAS domain-containing protein [Desulfotignum phosphitoxidans]EMS79690.1 PAS/PAC sensor hybrid histidine kinase [Desulfotignum phosphitoxidans DSM 13687]